MARRRQGSGSRPYARTQRVNELVREIVADELRAIDDERLEWVTITGVEVDNELKYGKVFFDSLDADAETDEVIGEALAQHRVRLQAAIGRQARMRRTPELSFRPDPAVRAGARVDEILRDLGPLPAADGEGGPGLGDDDADLGRTVGTDTDTDTDER